MPRTDIRYVRRFYGRDNVAYYLIHIIDRTYCFCLCEKEAGSRNNPDSRYGDGRRDTRVSVVYVSDVRKKGILREVNPGSYCLTSGVHFIEAAFLCVDKNLT